MKAIRLVGSILGLVAAIGSVAAQETGSRPEFVTEWVVTAAEGMDAILLLGAASGDLMQAEIYPEDINWVRSNLSPEGLEAMDRIDSMLRVRLGFLSGPTLAYFFSAGPLDSIDEVIASAADPVGRLKPGLMQSPRWDPEGFEAAVRLMPSVLTVLTQMRDAGFSGWYRDRYRDELLAAISSNLEAVTPYDIVPEQQRLLGRTLDPRIEILIVNFNRPYGIRISGQRFVAWYGWEAQIQLRVAAHELFHTPFEREDPELEKRLAALRQDPWLSNIVESHDPQFGYNSFEGVIDEDSTQALDQVVSERLGFARDPGQRWRHSDGGMHMMAAAIYQAMMVSGFADSGGSYADWLKASLENGLLTPESVQRLAAEVVGQEAVNAWSPE